MSSFESVKAVVTGGASGIGLAIVSALVAEGATVAVLDRAPEPPAELAGLAYFVADVSNDAEVRAAVTAAAAALGGIDVLVNNAGIGAQGTVVEASDDEWHRVLDVNVVGTARVSRAAWPFLVASERAAIVNTASIAATAGLPQRAVYSASKGAVLALTRAMAADGMADGVRVFTTGRNARGRFAGWDAIRVTVTARGHWYRLGDVPDSLHNDTVCRGCGHTGHFNYILDYRVCTAPATADDVLAALSGPARHVQPGDRVRLEVSEFPDPVVGTIQRLYRNVIGSDVADVELRGGRIFPQNIEFLTVVNY